MSINAYRVQTVPDTYAPFKISQAVEVGDLIFVSGQASIGKDGHAQFKHVGQCVGSGDRSRHVYHYRSAKRMGNRKSGECQQ